MATKLYAWNTISWEETRIWIHEMRHSRYIACYFVIWKQIYPWKVLFLYIVRSSVCEKMKFLRPSHNIIMSQCAEYKYYQTREIKYILD